MQVCHHDASRGCDRTTFAWHEYLALTLTSSKCGVPVWNPFALDVSYGFPRRMTYYNIVVSISLSILPLYSQQMQKYIHTPSVSLPLSLSLSLSLYIHTPYKHDYGCTYAKPSFEEWEGASPVWGSGFRVEWTLTQ